MRKDVVNPKAKTCWSISIPAKVYTVDTGLLNSISFRKSASKGPLLANLVFKHMRRNGYEVEYVRTRDGNEADFLAPHEASGNLAWMPPNSVIFKSTLDLKISLYLHIWSRLSVKKFNFQKTSFHDNQEKSACPNGSGKRYKNCCAILVSECSVPEKEQACSLVDRGNVLLAENNWEKTLILNQQALALH